MNQYLFLLHENPANAVHMSPAEMQETVARDKGLPLKEARVRVAREHTKWIWMRSQQDKAAKAQQATTANETVS